MGGQKPTKSLCQHLGGKESPSPIFLGKKETVTKKGEKFPVHVVGGFEPFDRRREKR